MMNAVASVKNLLIGVHVKISNYTWNPGTCECECNREFRTGKCLDLKNCKCQKRIFDKLILHCENDNIKCNRDHINC